MLNVIQRIINWNRDRNKLACSPSLEIAMLCEELQEFMAATTIIDQTDAYCDFFFVACGTRAKIANVTITDLEELADTQAGEESIEKYITSKLNYMATILYASWCDIFGDKHERSYNSYINQCVNFVITANEKKGTEKDADGKVIKPADFVCPEARMKAILDAFYTDLVDDAAEILQ